MIEYILSASACAGVVGYLAGRWSGERKSISRAIKHAADNALEWKRKYVQAACERDAAEKLHNIKRSQYNNLVSRINTAKALATPHMANIGHRMVKALDGNLVLVSDRTKQLREELEAVSKQMREEMKVASNG